MSRCESEWIGATRFLDDSARIDRARRLTKHCEGALAARGLDFGVIGAHHCPHAARSTCMRLMFQAMVTKLHSPWALASPRMLI